VAVEVDASAGIGGLTVSSPPGRDHLLRVGHHRHPNPNSKPRWSTRAEEVPAILMLLLFVHRDTGVDRDSEEVSGRTIGARVAG